MKKNMKKMVSAITMTAMAASMFAMPAAAEEKTSSITYPLETDIESVSWYAQEGIVHLSLRSILVWRSILA